jgi:hypothetical protein
MKKKSGKNCREEEHGTGVPEEPQSQEKGRSDAF